MGHAWTHVVTLKAFLYTVLFQIIKMQSGGKKRPRAEESLMTGGKLDGASSSSSAREARIIALFTIKDAALKVSEIMNVHPGA
jgi:hypothetical protein